MLKPNDLLDVAFRKAKKESGKGKKSRDQLMRRKNIEGNKIKVAADYLVKTLHSEVTSFPSLDKFNPFQIGLIGCLLEIKELKKALAQLESVSKILKKIRVQCIRECFSARKEREVFKAREKFFGRASSLVKSLDNSIEAVNNATKKLKELPQVKDMQTVILAGYPNTGKTSVLRRLSKSKAEVASYPFTTKQINLGYFEFKYHEIQVVDTPGLLDREKGKRNQIENKAVTALKHLPGLICFVADPTGECGYSLEQQLMLLKKIGEEFKEKKILVIVNKADKATEEQIKGVETEQEKIISGNGVNENLKKEIAERLIHN